jgi:hypothetical protein
MPLYSDAHFSLAAARLKTRVDERINRKISNVKQTADLVAASRNGLYDFGAYQLGALRSNVPCARFNTPGSSSIVCP